MMIIRYAFFDGVIHQGQEAAFRQAVLTELLPNWRRFPNAINVELSFAQERDEGAPSYPLILAISYPDRAALQIALDDPIRAQSRGQTEAVLARYFTGHIHHHICQSQSFAASA